MIQENKELLLKDLCARIPYGIKYIDILTSGIFTLSHIDEGYFYSKEKHHGTWFEECKPYLHSLSTMTNGERDEWSDMFDLPMCELASIIGEEEAEEKAPYFFAKCHSTSIDWLNAHHFDYRGLIGIGLALEAPEGMYK